MASNKTTTKVHNQQQKQKYISSKLHPTTKPTKLLKLGHTHPISTTQTKVQTKVDKTKVDQTKVDKTKVTKSN